MNPDVRQAVIHTYISSKRKRCCKWVSHFENTFCYLHTYIATANRNKDEPIYNVQVSQQEAFQINSEVNGRNASERRGEKAFRSGISAKREFAMAHLKVLARPVSKIGRSSTALCFSLPFTPFPRATRQSAPFTRSKGHSESVSDTTKVRSTNGTTICSARAIGLYDGR